TCALPIYAVRPERLLPGIAVLAERHAVQRDAETGAEESRVHREPATLRLRGLYLVHQPLCRFAEDRGGAVLALARPAIHGGAEEIGRASGRARVGIQGGAGPCGRQRA